VDIEHAPDGSLHLVASTEQAAQLSKLKELPISLDNLPYDYKLEEAKLKQFAEAKPAAGIRALAGASFGVVASIPAIVETYQIGKQEIEGGKVPVGAASYATKTAAELAVGSAASGAAAVTATPLLAMPPPVGEIAYGAAVLGAGYLGAEGTRKLMEQADYYTAKAKTYFQNGDAQASFAEKIRDNAQNNNQNPAVAEVLAYKLMDDQARQVNNRVAEHAPLQASRGMEP
jgi:hypothetical protein